MIGTVRFSKIVESAGKPSVLVLWIDPEKDAILQNAVKANRVMTIHQHPDGTKTDYATIGFDKNVSGQVLIFPKSLRSFADKRVIGVKYDLLESAAAPKSQQAPKVDPAKPAIKSKPKEIPVATIEPPVAEESALPKSQQAPKAEPAKPAIKSKPKEIPVAAVEPHVAKESAPARVVKFPVSEVEAEDLSNEDVEEIKKQVRQAMKMLEEGKQVAAFNLLKRIVE